MCCRFSCLHCEDGATASVAIRGAAASEVHCKDRTAASGSLHKEARVSSVFPHCEDGAAASVPLCKDGAAPEGPVSRLSLCGVAWWERCARRVNSDTLGMPRAALLLS